MSSRDAYDYPVNDGEGVEDAPPVTLEPPVTTTVRAVVKDECPGCSRYFEVGTGYSSGGYVEETFCSWSCYVDEMERRQERVHDRGM